mmetsp:Transcript_11272/g.47070  ORF Transcript_11272/g.47070 Transcript_11272/m.47070 type:complete len:295 (-) Transcript_11272:249-1133(-)
MSGIEPSRGSLPLPSFSTKRPSAAASSQNCGASGAVPTVEATSSSARRSEGMDTTVHALYAPATASRTFSWSIRRPSCRRASLTAAFSFDVLGSSPLLLALYSCIACTRSTAKGTCACVASSSSPSLNSRTNASSSSQGECSRRSSTSLSGLASTTQCSDLDTLRDPSRPYDRAASSGTPSRRQTSSSFTSVCSHSCVAMTNVKALKNSGRASSRVRVLSSTNAPSTASLSSWSAEHASSARDAPTLPAASNQLFPRSRGSTRAMSTTVNAPMPPSTRFLRVSVPVGPAPSRHT